MPRDDIASLQQSAHEVDVELTDETARQLLQYLSLLQRWNAVYNLTAIRDPNQMRVQHLHDCLAIVAPLKRWLDAESGRLLDVGSGGGLPGFVIACVCRGVQVTCVDAVGKKAAFIAQVAAELSLPNLHSIHARVESLRLPGFDVIASRAFSSLAEFVRLTHHLIAKDGCWLAMKAKPVPEEIAALPGNVELFHVEQLRVPGLAADRSLLWMRPRLVQ
jgi:16S rRNA (guanine527-N7)-methyltransferase